MVWDTGFAPGSNPNAPKTSLADHLAQVKVKPEQVKFVGISHFHGDHTGQLAPFTNATLLIGKGDWDGVNRQRRRWRARTRRASSTGSPRRQGRAADRDKDVFGDGTVVILRTPGHTPGHSSLLVRLKEKGPVLLTGDLAHFRENYESNGVPSFNFDRAQTARLDRALQADREEPEGDRDHPARPARHRQAAGVSGRREVRQS